MPKGALGLGVDVKSGVSILKGTVLGAYGGCLGTRLGADDYTVEMPPVRHERRTYRIAVSAARGEKNVFFRNFGNSPNYPKYYPKFRYSWESPFGAFNVGGCS